MDTYFIIDELIFPVYEAIIIFLSYILITNRRDLLKNNKTKSGVFVLIYTLISFWATITFPVGYHSLIITLVIVITTAFITKVNLLTSFISTIIIAIFFIASELLIGSFITIVSDISFSDIFEDTRIRFYITFIIKTFQLLVVLFLYKFKKPLIKRLYVNSKDPIKNYWIFGVFLILMFIFSLKYVISFKADIILYEILLFLIFLIYIILGYFDYKEKIKLQKIKYEHKLQEEYIENLETIVNIVRREKHDFTNHINTIYAICELNKPNAVETIHSYVNKISSNLKSSYHFFDTGNDYIDGLLAVKSNFAFENNIYYEVEFEASIDEINLDDNDLISILSNIIDNAFDAIESQSDRRKDVVSIYSYVEDNKYNLSISNNGPIISKEKIKKIFENGFSTKSENKKDHGLGLCIVKKLVDKYNGEILVSSTEGETEFLMKFPLRTD